MDRFKKAAIFGEGKYINVNYPSDLGGKMIDDITAAHLENSSEADRLILEAAKMSFPLDAAISNLAVNHNGKEFGGGFAADSRDINFGFEKDADAEAFIKDVQIVHDDIVCRVKSLREYFK